MDAGVIGEFRVEGCGDRSSLPDRDWVFALGGDDFDGSAYAPDFGGANEDHLQRRDGLVVERALQKLAFADGAVELAPVGIAADGHVDGAQAGLLGVFDFSGKQDCAGAGAEGRLEAYELFQLFEAFFSQQFQERSALAAGNDEAVDFIELRGLFDEHNFGAEFFETATVSVEIALQGEDSDFHDRFSLPEEMKIYASCGLSGASSKPDICI